MPCSDVEDTRVGLQYVYPPQQASGLTIDPSLFETSFLGQPSNVSVHVEAGVGIAGTYYGFVEDHLSRGLGEPLPILSDRGQSTTAWSLATHYETSAMICPPSAVSEGRKLASFTTGDGRPRPVLALDEVCAGPYLGADTNSLDAPSRVRPVHPTSRPPLWRYAVKMQDTPSSAPEFAPAEARLQTSARGQRSSPAPSNSLTQRAPTRQRRSKGTTSQEAYERAIVEIKTQLPTRAPQHSPRPDVTHDTLGMSNRLCENCRFIIPSLGHTSGAEDDLRLLVAPSNPNAIEGESLHGTREAILEDDRGSYTEIRSLASTHVPLGRSTRFARTDTTSFPAHRDLTDGQSLARHTAKGKQSSSGVQRTERSRRGRNAGTPLCLRRKKHASYERNLETLQERCRGQGGDDEAIGHLSAIFEEGVDAKALSREITEEEIASNVFGSSTEPRQVYWALLGQQVKDGFIRYTCRLCPEEKRYPYKNGKDVVPHIRKCHVGIEGGTG